MLPTRRSTATFLQAGACSRRNRVHTAAHTGGHRRRPAGRTARCPPGGAHPAPHPPPTRTWRRTPSADRRPTRRLAPDGGGQRTASRAPSLAAAPRHARACQHTQRLVTHGNVHVIRRSGIGNVCAIIFVMC